MKLNRSGVQAIVCAFIAVISANAQAGDAAPPDQARLPIVDYDNAAIRTFETYDSTGMVAAVSINGEVVFNGAYGLAEEGTDRPVTTDMLFPIASISKAFTTTALAILVDRGEIAWDHPVQRYIPEFAMYDPWVSEHFTIRDALTHRSGLPLGAGDLLIWPDGDADVDDVIAAIPHLKPSTGFRDSFAYDNLLYVVAGEIVERVSGESWADFVTTEILTPVGLDNCAAQRDRIRPDAKTVTGHERAAGQDTSKPIDERLELSPTWAAAAGIYCTAGDIMKWSEFWLDDGVTADGKRLVSEDQVKQLWTGVTPTSVRSGLRDSGSTHLAIYALGWVVQDFEGSLMITHSGGAPGVMSNLILLPEHDIAIFASSNDYRPAAHAFTYQIANALLGRSEHDFITEWGASFAKDQQEGLSVITRTVQLPEDPAAPSLPLAAYTGTYRDPWYGDVRIRQDADGLFIDMGRSTLLDGHLIHYSGDQFAAFWPDTSLKADAFVYFEVEDGKVTGMTMKAISDLTDFSYDFHDLHLERAPTEAP